MTGWSEVTPDIILSLLYIYLLIRLGSSKDDYFKTPFFVFFIVTGVYSIIAVVGFHVMVQFPYNEQFWTIYILKPAYVLNNLGAVGSTLGKVYIAIHRYFVLRTSDFSEKKWSFSLILRLSLAQFIISLFLTIPVVPASYLYRNGDKNSVIVSLDTTTTLILKLVSVCTYVIYVVVNTIFTILTSRELIRLKKLLEDNAETSQAIVLQQRNMFIIVAVCSVSHLVKALHQFAIAVVNSLGLIELQVAIRLWYPLVNGLATYATPICLIILSRNVRARLFFFRKGSVNSTTSSTLTGNI